MSFLQSQVRTEADVAFLLNAVDSPHNGITMCVGTFGSHAGNDVEGMVERFKERIHFVHLRNVQQLDNGLYWFLRLWYSCHMNFGTFVESDHLDGRVDMFRVLTTLLNEQACPFIVLRGNHELSHEYFIVTTGTA